MLEIYFKLEGISKNRSSIFRGFTEHNSISLTNISRYFRFAKELVLYKNDNYVGSNENALIYIMDAAHKTIEIGEETRRSSNKSHRIRFPTMWCVRPAKSQISLRMRAV